MMRAELVKTAMERLGLPPEPMIGFLKVSRTIADLAASEEIKIEHLQRLYNTGVWIGRDGRGESTLPFECR